MSRVLAVAGLTFREAWRRRVVVAALVMTAGFLGLYALGLYFAGQKMVESFASEGGPLPAQAMKAVLAGQLLTMGLFPASLVVGLVAVLSGAGSISAEADSGVLHAVAARPFRRWELVVGKSLGLGSMVAVYTVLVTGAVIALARWLVGAPVQHLPSAMALLVLEPLILLSIAILGTSRLPTVANGVLCVALWGMGFVGGVIEQVGSLIEISAMRNIGIATSLLMPVDAIHRKAVTVLMPGMVGLGGAVDLPIAASSTPSVWMVVYACVYLLAAVWLGTGWFARRDL